MHADAAEGRKKARGVQPGSFLNLMINSKHSNGEPFSDLLASSQAFTFLLVRVLLCISSCTAWRVHASHSPACATSMCLQECGIAAKCWTGRDSA